MYNLNALNYYIFIAIVGIYVCKRASHDTVGLYVIVCVCVCESVCCTGLQSLLSA